MQKTVAESQLRDQHQNNPVQALPNAMSQKGYQAPVLVPQGKWNRITTQTGSFPV